MKKDISRRKAVNIVNERQEELSEELTRHFREKSNFQTEKKLSETFLILEELEAIKERLWNYGK